MSRIQEALDVILSQKKIVIHAKEQSCNRYPQLPGTPTPGCAECGLGELYGKKYQPENDFVTLDNDYRAFRQKAKEGTASITLLGGEMLQDIQVITVWPTRKELIVRYGINPRIIEKISEYRGKIGKPINENEPMEMWERDALIPTAMISSLGMIPHVTSNFDLLRSKKGESCLKC